MKVTIDTSLYLDPLTGVKVRREGCTHCGRGVERLVFTDRTGQQQTLRGDVALMLWDVLERESHTRMGRIIR